MTYPNSASLWPSVLILSAALVGCGGGSSSSGGGDSTQTGQFIDSAVEGLVYQRFSDNAMTGEGVTNASGEFSYREEETVVFFLGEQPIGYGVGEEIVTPFDILPLTGSSSDDRVINVARLLQSLDTSGDLADGISLPSESAFEGLDEIDFDDESSLQDALEHILDSSAVLVSKEEARAHLLDTLAALDRLPVKTDDLESELVHFDHRPRLNCEPELENPYSDSNLQMRLTSAGNIEISGTLTPAAGGALVSLEPSIMDETGSFTGQLSDGLGAFQGHWSRGRSWGSLLAPDPEENCRERVGFARAEAMVPRFMPWIASFITDIEAQTDSYQLDLRVGDFFGVVDGPGVLTYSIDGQQQPEVTGNEDGSLEYLIGPMDIGTGFEWEYLVGYNIGGDSGTITTGGSRSPVGSDNDDGETTSSGTFVFCAEDYSVQHCGRLLMSGPAPDQPGFLYDIERRENWSVSPTTGGFCNTLQGGDLPLTIQSFAGTSDMEITLPNGLVLDPEPWEGAGSPNDRGSCKICYQREGESCGDLN